MSVTHIPAGSERQDAALPAQSISTPEPTYELVDFDRYVITHDGPVGYVEVVSPVFVCYLGHPYAHAEEIAQVHSFEQAVRLVGERAASSQRHKLAT
ncbi:hypothetical protein [Microbacterium sp.]|uniref:hypothetical protein n=1 Tax=Microbacterium sp. TaxID=51671 RepID=UPI002812077E|nr:hypothetical protein [Microbacterium sp.]